MSGYRTRSAAETLARISAGTSPWVAVGDFVDDWHRSDEGERWVMIADPPAVAVTPDEERWAAFVAAAVDQLAWDSDSRIEPPDWVGEPRFVLPEPWFLLPGWRLRMHQLVNTPAAFKRRRIYGGDRIIARA